MHVVVISQLDSWWVFKWEFYGEETRVEKTHSSSGWPAVCQVFGNREEVRGGEGGAEGHGVLTLMGSKVELTDLRPIQASPCCVQIRQGVVQKISCRPVAERQSSCPFRFATSQPRIARWRQVFSFVERWGRSTEIRVFLGSTPWFSKFRRSHKDPSDEEFCGYWFDDLLDRVRRAWSYLVQGSRINPDSAGFLFLWWGDSMKLRKTY